MCGESVEVDGVRKLVRWWVRGDGDRLDRIVSQEPGSSLVNEKRYVYDSHGRLQRVERWETRDGHLVLDQYNEYVRGETGRLVSIRWVVPHRGDRDAYQENDAVTVDAAGRLVGSDRDRDAKGRLVRVRNGASPFLTVEYAPDGLSATETFARGLVVRWTFDAKGVPLTASSPVNGNETEVDTWHRVCTGLPPLPTEPGAATGAGTPG